MSKAYKGRREDFRLVTGQGKYTSDWNLARQLYGYFLRSDRAHAEIASIDVQAARSSPGVIAVFTGTDTAKAGFKSTPQLARYPGRGGMLIKVPHRDGLANGRVRFVGQEVSRPPDWGGYRLRPERVEFWHGFENRLHDRVLHVREGSTWRIERLSP